MRILVGWDNESEIDLIGMYLGVDGSDVVTALGPNALQEQIASGERFDVVLLAINMPEVDDGYELFHKLQREWLDTPIVGACQPQEVFKIVRFMANGMNGYVIRDGAGDYMFMLQTILESTVDAVRAAREQQLAAKLREEVDSVRKLQESVIPRHIDAPPGYQIRGRYEPSQIRVVGGQAVTMAGGDYYDIFTLADNSIVLLVGDASGHGMKAAMSIMTMHTLVRMIRSQKYTDTAHFVTEINKQLCEQTIVSEEGGFITLLYAIFNPETRELQWTSAGHPPPFVHDYATGTIAPLGNEDVGGLPLAVTEWAEYETYRNVLPEDFRLLLFTDGLEEAFPEARKGAHHQFGFAGIMQSMLRNSGKTIDETLQALFDDSNAFTEGSGRHDDTSVVLLERRPI